MLRYRKIKRKSSKPAIFQCLATKRRLFVTIEYENYSVVSYMHKILCVDITFYDTVDLVFNFELYLYGYIFKINNLTCQIINIRIHLCYNQYYIYVHTYTVWLREKIYHQFAYIYVNTYIYTLIITCIYFCVNQTCSAHISVFRIHTMLKFIVSHIVFVDLNFAVNLNFFLN